MNTYQSHSSTILLCLTIAWSSSNVAAAAVKSKVVTYKDGETTCQGYVAWDDSVSGLRPGVLVVHEWWGLNDYAKRRADMLAELGYVAFAADMYGDGQVTEHPQEAGKMASLVRENVDAWVQRGTAGLETLKQQPDVDSENLAVMGYCFGGSTALQLAFHGATVKAAISCHGALPVPTAEQVKNIKGAILVCHGADDKFITTDTIKKFCTALDAGQANWEMSSYPGAKHSFTVKESTALGIPGMEYNASADEKSWEQTRALLKKQFEKQ